MFAHTNTPTHNGSNRTPSSHKLVVFPWRLGRSLQQTDVEPSQHLTPVLLIVLRTLLLDRTSHIHPTRVDLGEHACTQVLPVSTHSCTSDADVCQVGPGAYLPRCNDPAQTVSISHHRRPAVHKQEQRAQGNRLSATNITIDGHAIKSASRSTLHVGEH